MKSLVFILVLISFPAMGEQDWYHSPEAEGIPFDPEDSGLVSEFVGPAIREIRASVGDFLSPGFTFGAPGNKPTNSWLNYSGVSSNLSGAIAPVDGCIKNLTIVVRDPTIITVAAMGRVGESFAALASVSLLNERKKSLDVDPCVEVSKEDEFAAQVSSGSGKDLVFTIQISGTL